jgi:LacI family transcriptional regulator
VTGGKTKAKRTSAEKNVLILMWSSTISSGRDFLAGFASHARHRRDWRLHLRMSRTAIEPNILQAIRCGGYNGIVTDEDSYNSIPKGTIPADTSVVVFGTYNPQTPKNVVFVQNDNAAIGRFGGHYLLELGRFRSFGFVPTEVEHGWSQTRATAFAKEIGRRKQQASIFSHGVHASLKAWLAALPKPAAIMAACDRTALETVEACKRARISIPQQISILGVDNDELLCEFDSPTISSILPRHDTVGEMAARALSRMFRGWPPGRPRREICTDQTIVERESTAPLAPATHLVTSALAFIRQNATKAITTDDVVRHLGVSRSLASLRFREYQGETIRAAILRTRLEEVKKRLASTRLTVSKVARVCGFTDIPHLQVVFKRQFGLPMGRWRAANAP